MNTPRLKINVYDTFIDAYKDSLIYQHIKLSKEDKDNLKRDLYYAVSLIEGIDKMVSFINDYRTSSK